LISSYYSLQGIWTKEQRGEPVNCEEDSTSFDLARPTIAHQALVTLLRSGKLKHIISQNVDGLHLRSGIPEENLSELHGNTWYCV
jgi:mono-ADP-ribosyltransferase sirtuin 6